MPVYDYTYKTWEGERRGPLFRWMAIPKFTCMEFFSHKMLVWLLTLGFVQLILRLVYVYLLVNQEFLRMLSIPAGVLPPLDGLFFKSMIDLQLIFCFLLAFVMGAGLISRDLRHNAAVLYLTKPISQWEYFLGKFATLFPFLMLLTGVQAAFLFGVQAWIAPENSEWNLYFWQEYFWILGAILLYSTVISISLTLIVLAASSLTKHRRYAGLAFAVYIIGSSIVGRIVAVILENRDYLALSPFRAGIDLGFYLFRMGEDRDITSQWAAWAGILGVWLLCALVLKWRVGCAARYGR